ncbi:MAG: hypothetical protein ABII07_00940 [Patescibacteria group bacterium]|nr:hypothetical protein [Patescibacteria group bacterium]
MKKILTILILTIILFASAASYTFAQDDGIDWEDNEGDFNNELPPQEEWGTDHAPDEDFSGSDFSGIDGGENNGQGNQGMAAIEAAEAEEAASNDYSSLEGDDPLLQDETNELNETELGDDFNPNAGSEESDSQSEEEDNTSIMPNIPKPKFLPGPTEGSSKSEITTYFREKAVPDFVAGFIGVVGLMAFLALVISGIQFLTAYGNDERVTAAKKTATYAAVGFILAILSYAIVSIISSLQLEAPEEPTSFLQIHTAYADEIEIGSLLPTQENLIEKSPNANGVSLPEGDLTLDTIPQIINILLGISGVIVFISFAYAGILLVISQGNEDDINKAQNIIIYSIIGVIIIALSYSIVYGISKINF